MFNQDLEKVLNELPENGHKVCVMYAWHKLMKKLNIPEPFRNNVELVQALSEFSLNFLTALGFSTGVIFSKSDSDPTVKLSYISSSISILIPFVMNVLIKVKLSGKQYLFPMFAHAIAQMNSVLSLSAVFVQGLKLCATTASWSIGEQLKNDLLIGMAGVYAGHHAGELTYEILMRSYKILFPPKADNLLPVVNANESTTDEENISYSSILAIALKPNLEKIKSIVRGYEKTRELQFLIILFILMIININEGANEYTRSRGFDNPFALNVVLFPLTSIISSVLAYLYAKLIGHYQLP